MSARNRYWDNQYQLTDPYYGTKITVGSKGQVVSTGTNYTPAERLAKDWSHPHNYSLVYYDRGDSYGQVWNKCYSKYAYQLLKAEAKINRPWTANDDIKLYNKLKEKYDDSEFSAPIFVGELGETTDMLAGNLRRLAQAGRLARKGNLIEAAKVLGKEPRRHFQRHAKPTQGLAQRWLELQYGWLPLMSDISHLADYIATLDKPGKRRISANHWIGMTPYSNYLYGKCSGTGKYSKQIIAYVTEDRPSPLERLGLLDPESVVWELVPFSFVADWVYPIGSYLDARSIARRAKGTFVITTKTAYNSRVEQITAPDIGCWQWQDRQPQLLCWHRRVELVRNVYTSLPDVKPPVFRKPFGGPGHRLANAVALVVSIFGGKINVTK